MAWYTSNSDKREARQQVVVTQSERHSASDRDLQADLIPANDEFDYERLRDIIRRLVREDIIKRGGWPKLPPTYPENLPFGFEDMWDAQKENLKVRRVQPKPGKARPVPASVRRREEGLKRMREEARLRRIARLKSLKTVGTTVANVTKRNPYGFAFQLGWRIGTYIFGDPFFDGDETVGAEGYLGAGPGQVWHTCTDGPPPCNLGAYSYYYATESPPTCFGVAQQCSNGFGGTLVVGHGTPAEAYAIGDPVNGAGTVVAARKVVQSGYYFRVGDWFTPLTDPDMGNPANWTQTGQLVPGFGTTVETVPAEQPDLWPMTVPVRVAPQKWAEAKPKPGQQERKAQRAAYVVPPMVPFPAVLIDIETVPAPLRPPVVSIGTKVGVRDRMKLRWKQSKAQRKRTSKNRKEIKLNVVSVMPKTWAMINVATETQDFLEAMHKGLPKECRAKPRKRGAKVPPHRILRAIWNCWDHFDGAKALTAFINNQFEDFVYGKLGKLGSKATRNMKLTTGLQRQIRQHANRINEERVRQGKDPLILPLPQLKYDADADEWSLDLAGGS